MKESLLLDVFMHVAVFLVIAALVVPLFKRFKIPSALSYLIAGIALGPQGLGTISTQLPFLEYITLQNSADIHILSELGIVFLLFVIGLELTPQKLWQMRGLVFGLGTAQVAISAVVIGSIAYMWGNSIPASILLGLGLSLSSTAIITQWLHEKKLFNTQAGQASFSILLLQDLAVIPILLLITLFTADVDGGLVEYISTLVGKILLAIIAIVAMGKYLVKPVFHFSGKYGSDEVFIALSLLVIVISSSLAGMAGLSLALGAFIGGLLLAETQYSQEISSIIVPFKSMLLGVFFMAFGMTIDVQFITEKPFWLFASVMGLMCIKSAIIYALCRLWRMPKAVAVESALLLPQAGEFGLLVVGSSLTFGLLDQSVGQFMFLTIGMSMILSPIMAPISQKIGINIGKKEQKKDVRKAEMVDTPLSGHVVIMGYGRMGQTVSEILAQQGINSVSFDINTDVLKQAQRNNMSAYYGDATKKNILSAAHIDKASSVVITIDDPAATKKIYKNVRNNFESIPIIIRTHKLKDLAGLKHAKYVHIIPEYLSTSLVLTKKALEYAGYTSEEARKVIQEVH
jgi:CPA2 family monovalent cation:H+ antiporter-2